MARLSMMVLVVGWALAHLGCQPSAKNNPATSAAADAKTADSDVSKVEKPDVAKDSGKQPREKTPDRGGIQSGFLDSGARSTTAMVPDAGADELVRRITTIIDDAVEFGPSLVVWIVDTSKSGMTFHESIVAGVERYYRTGIAGDAQADADRLLSAVVTFGQQVQFPLETPTADRGQVASALSSLEADDSGQEVPFAALQASLDKYLDFRTTQRREVLMIVLTDEQGNDWQSVDQVIEAPKKYAIPIYVLGPPAPFGARAALPDSVEPAGINQGPESRQLEHVSFAQSDGFETDLMDSGFGPFALEYLCRSTGGSYLALRPSRTSFSAGGSWPNSIAARFDPKIMRRYAPDYVSQSEYDAFVQSNRACQALLAAARQGEIELLGYPVLEFEKQDEAALKRLLDRAQQAPAKVEQAVNNVYEILREGSADREQLTRPRWQAAYDLAFGRAAAGKARIDGYNAMLAALKRGRNFENAESRFWVLEPAEVYEAGSGLERIAERARESLERVVRDHPGTPWAALAEKELATPMGWQWTEK